MEKAEIVTMLDYEQEKPFRLKEAQLAIGGLYQALFSFNEYRWSRWALRANIQLHEILDDQSRVAFSPLDSDLQPVLEHVCAGIQDGILDFGTSKFGFEWDWNTVTNAPDQVTFSTGFLKDYEPLTDDKLLYASVDLERVLVR